MSSAAALALRAALQVRSYMPLVESLWKPLAQPCAGKGGAVVTDRWLVLAAATAVSDVS